MGIILNTISSMFVAAVSEWMRYETETGVKTMAASLGELTTGREKEAKR